MVLDLYSDFISFWKYLIKVEVTTFGHLVALVVPLRKWIAYASCPRLMDRAPVWNALPTGSHTLPHTNQRRQLIREEAIPAQRKLLLSRFTLTQSLSAAA